MKKLKNYKKKHSLKKALEFNNEKYVIESIMNQNNELDDSDLQKLDLINIKCLILWGENDKIIDKSYGQALNKYIKGSDLEIIKNAEHVSHYSNAAEVKNLLLKFINYK
jgi:Predicted hydrolases or acyltransferases (alpha/beta hydrolase superfamily)